MINKSVKNVQTMIGLVVVIDGSVKLENGIIVYGKLRVMLIHTALFD